MAEIQREVVAREVTIPAAAETVYINVADLSSWPQFHPAAVHAETVRRDLDGVLVRHWALAGGSSVRTWESRWQFDPAARRIRFTHESPPAPLRSLEGEWTFEDRPDGACRASLSHTFTFDAADRDRTEAIAASLTRNTQELLDTARDTAAPNIQFFDMETKAPDGSVHSTRSVRVCRPEHLIVYKQTVLPALLDAHTGHWRMVETPEGVLASARHTVTIKRSALPLLGEHTTVNDARRYLRRSLSVHAVRNLTLAKDYAEELAGV